jgi:hypothetical protein
LEWNTLICEGQWGRIFEVTPDKESVWEYVSPFMGPDRHGDLPAANGSKAIVRSHTVGGPFMTRSDLLCRRLCFYINAGEAGRGTP